VQEFWLERRHWHCIEFESWFTGLIERGVLNNIGRDVSQGPHWVESAPKPSASAAPAHTCSFLVCAVAF
jgi:hypothetical protein